MTVSTLRFLVLAAFLLTGSQVLQAQQTGGGTGSGGTGGTGTGGTGSTGGTGGGSSIGAPSATGAGGALTADAAFSAVDRGATVGSTGNTGSGFSELSAAGGGAAGGLSGLGGSRGLGGGGLGGLGGLSSLFGGLNTQGQAAKPAIRTRLRSAVLYEPHPPEVVERRVGLQFRSLPQPELRGVRVTMEGRKAIISGVVETDRHRRMSEMLLRLEPGVSEIDNQLVVGTP